MHQVIINVEDKIINKIYGFIKEFSSTDIEVVSDKTMDTTDATKIADDYLESIDDPDLVSMMKEIRALRGTPPQFAGYKSDNELFAEAIEMKLKESGEI